MTCDEDMCSSARAIYNDLEAIQELVVDELDCITQTRKEMLRNERERKKGDILQLRERTTSLEEIYFRLGDILDVVNVEENKTDSEKECDDDDCNCHQ